MKELSHLLGPPLPMDIATNVPCTLRIYCISALYVQCNFALVVTVLRLSESCIISWETNKVVNERVDVHDNILLAKRI